MSTLSYRQICLQYGFNAYTVRTLVAQGVLLLAEASTPLRPKVLLTSLRSLQEGRHYVVCQACQSFQASITLKHLQSCAGYTLAEYQKRYPAAQVSSRFCDGQRAKSPKQRQAQSTKLRDRFRSEAGQITKKQISTAAKALHAGGYREKAAAFLTKLNNSPQMKATKRAETKQRWAHGDLRLKQAQWAANNPDKVLAGAANARRHNKKKYTKLHQTLREALIRRGIQSQTEYEVGYYSIDEAIPALQIAIEADGCYWHGCATCGFDPVQGNAAKDKAKDTFLTNRGWMVLRFPGHLILADPDHCVSLVQAAIQKRSQHA